MAWFGAAYAVDETKDGRNPYDYSNRNQFFGGQSDTQAGQALNQANGGYQDPNAVAQQTQYNAQANAVGLANSARGGRGNSMMRSAMLQAPQARQAGMQAGYAQQQANFQNAAAARDFESQRRAAVEQQTLGQQKNENEQALQQQRDTNNTIAAINGMGDAVKGGLMSDERTKRVLGGKMGAPSPSVVIMIGCGEHEHGGMGDDDEDEDEDEAGDDATEAMRELEPASFKYKPEFQDEPGAGRGEYTGIMAQDLERTPAGRGAVMTGPDGIKRVDGAKLSALNSAALSKVVKDVDRLKGAKRA